MTAGQGETRESAGPLRLVMVAGRFWPLAGGPEKMIARLGAELVARGCQVTVLTAAWDRSWSQQITFRGMPVVRLPHAPGGRSETARYVRAMARWLAGNLHYCDLVYVSQLKHEAYAAVRTVGDHVPVVLRAEKAGRHGDCLWQIDATCRRKIKRQCIKAAALVGSSTAIERELQAAGYRRDRIYHVPDGVPAAPPRDPAAKAAARAALADANVVLDVPNWAPLAVCTGQLDPQRGLGQVIQAWRPIVARWPHARLWLAGESDDRTAAARQIEASGLAGRVVPAGVFDEVDELLAAADLFVSPSPQAETPLALLEAMAAGLPIVADDCPGNREAITDGREGLLVSSAQALSSAIEHLIDQPDLAARLGTAARQRAEAEFSLAGTVDDHATLFERLVQLNPTPAGA